MVLDCCTNTETHTTEAAGRPEREEKCMCMHTVEKSLNKVSKASTDTYAMFRSFGISNSLSSKRRRWDGPSTLIYTQPDTQDDKACAKRICTSSESTKMSVSATSTRAAVKVSARVVAERIHSPFYPPANSPLVASAVRLSTEGCGLSEVHYAFKEDEDQIRMNTFAHRIT